MSDQNAALLRAARSRPDTSASTRAHLRHLAITAGLEHQHVAFGLTLILDEIARHMRDLDDELRRRVVEPCEQLRTERPRQPTV
jgi:hypothetical protein